METFILKLAIAVIPLVVVVAFVTLITTFKKEPAHHTLSWLRTRSGR